MEDIGLAHGLTRFIHLLLFVYWLGGDFGVFYSSRFVQNTSLSREARLTAAKIFINLDMIPRYCLALMLTVGGVLGEFVGVTHEWWELAGIVLLGPVWVALVHLVHAREGTQAGNTLKKIDYWFRWIMVVAIVGHVVYANMTGRLVGSQAWFSAKLVLFAFLIFCGLMIRRHLPLWAEGFRVLVAGNATPESDQKMLDGMGRSLKYVFMIWAGILLEALLGILKPGIG